MTTNNFLIIFFSKEELTKYKIFFQREKWQGEKKDGIKVFISVLEQMQELKEAAKFIFIIISYAYYLFYFSLLYIKYEELINLTD